MSITPRNYPKNINFLNDASATFVLTRIPNTVFFSQGMSIPGISLGRTNQPTPLVDQPIPGDKMTFDDFPLTFKVDEDLKNYIEIQEWMRGLGFPYSHNEYGDLIRNSKMNQVNPSIVVSGRRPVLDANSYSDGSLTILNNNNHPILDVTFVRLFPYQLTGLDFSTSNGETTEITATVTFAYSYYYFRDIKTSKNILPVMVDGFSNVALPTN
jgi:hypothetical protein